MKIIQIIKIGVFCFCLISFAQTNSEEQPILITKKADSLLKINQLEEAKILYLRLDSLATKTNQTKLEIDAKKGLLRVLYFQGQPDLAIKLGKELLEITAQTGDQGAKAYALSHLGINYSAKNEYDAAIQHLEEALKIDTVANENSLRTKIAIANIYYKTNELLKAKEIYEGALVYAKELGNPRAESLIYNGLGSFEIKNNNFEKALEYRKKAIKIREKNNLSFDFIPYANIGNNYGYLKQYDSAMYYYKKAYDLVLETNNPISLGKININIGEMFYKRKEYDSAITYLSRTHEIADSIGNSQIGLISSEVLTNVYKDIKDFEKTSFYLEKQLSWKDSIHKNATDKKLEEFITKYETKQKEERIAALDQENRLKATIIKQKQRQKTLLWIVFVIVLGVLGIIMWIWQRINKKQILARQENLRFKAVIEAEQKERKRIAQDLHDSLGQSISVIKMQASALQLPDDEISKQKILLKQINNTYDELRDISHNIMPSTLITLGLVPAVRELITEIDRDGTLQIHLKNDSDFKNLDENQIITLYRIIQEAIVNIIKHAKATLVNINLENREGVTSLYIIDNGKGMDASNINNNPGLGWKNIFSRVDLLSGDIKVTSKPNQGTSIAIHLRSS